ncbi:unnamed protein product [Protopolystoma xenopodis]|uniref:RSE1/DDB1/CPSF1 second beta-propeller domain-containing protein n=1 Tax=Protopolystoma xenopodis TaxID=117903 RepID=A0A448WMG4_9PLAT|nr:unnamed protein product [Protopolystoma xenopodis]
MLTYIQNKLVARPNLLCPFEEIGGHRGVFVSGGQPMWLFSGHFGELRVFPHAVDGVVPGFTPLHTATLPNGFVYFTCSVCPFLLST